MRAVILGGALLFACRPDVPAGTDSGAGTSTTDADPAPTTAGTWSDDYGPCADDQSCPAGSLCVQLESASVCGPECYEKGPGSFRCPQSEVQAQAICPWLMEDGKLVPAPCLISCTDATDCPDPAMVCLPCPEHFAYDCTLGVGFGAGPDMCAWPDP